MTFKEQVACLRRLGFYDYDECADTMEGMKARIKELEMEVEAIVSENERLNEGGCRRDCRKRKEYCQSFAYYVCKNRKSLMTPTAKVLKDMYADWNKDQ